jgi:hypothetical protein
LERLAQEAPEEIPAQLQAIVQEYRRGEQRVPHEQRFAA